MRKTWEPLAGAETTWSEEVTVAVAVERQVMEQSTARLQLATADAVNALQAIVSSPDSPPSTRVAAARTILDMAYRAVEVDELGERVHSIETIVEEMKI